MDDYTYISCVSGVDGKDHPEGVVQHSLVTALLQEARDMPEAR